MSLEYEDERFVEAEDEQNTEKIKNSTTLNKIGAPMTNFIRQKVSLKKCRFVNEEHNFDLDLTYIMDRIIAMGFPSEGHEGLYRNPMKEVQRWLNTFHDQHYKIYNLCAERSYPAERFENNFACFPFPDHNPPPFWMV